MNTRFFQIVGWVSLIFSFAVAGRADSGALTVAQMLSASLLGVAGLLCSLYGQYRAAVRRAQRVPVRVAPHDRRPR